MIFIFIAASLNKERRLGVRGRGQDQEHYGQTEGGRGGGVIHIIDTKRGGGVNSHQ